MKKTFAVYYKRDVNEQGQLYSKIEEKQFNEAIFDLRDSLAEKDIDLILITQQNPYVGNGQFYGYWEPNNNRRFEKVIYNIFWPRIGSIENIEKQLKKP